MPRTSVYLGIPRETKPIVSHGGFCWANTLIFASSYSLGAWDTLWLPLGFVISFSIVAVLSLKYGEGDFRLTMLQKVCVLGAVAGAATWWISGSALLALVFTIVIDFLGIVPTIYKAYLRPWHENKLAWGIALVASVFYILAVDEWSLAIAAYPVYVLVTNTILALLIIPPRRTQIQQA